ncbi:MAG: RecX family transcriptional regulator [Bacteroidales bacterium]|nr:RecX family transcriptional regulator [Bacteroidales bacterium]
MDERLKKVLVSLQGRCARREYCRAEMRQKALKALDGDAAAAEEILESLVADGFVDDARYAGAFAREKAVLDGWGPVKIRYMLRGKGIEASDIDEALASIDAGAASEKLDKLLAAKAKSLQGDPQARLKLIKYALSRGYNYEDIKV